MGVGGGGGGVVNVGGWIWGVAKGRGGKLDELLRTSLSLGSDASPHLRDRSPLLPPFCPSVPVAVFFYFPRRIMSGFLHLRALLVF